eukprot:TRINITY_DN62872_c0_g1_i1.p1 TRINITY_DN62872_c0_g1~~TRINITY_DN62872_c0_g1_i1.p1  ORF type:complete len:392 (-),score=60.32 TRINITY_DN62872_c0_g1_i1:108-1217(-)
MQAPLSPEDSRKSELRWAASSSESAVSARSALPDAPSRSPKKAHGPTYRARHESRSGRTVGSQEGGRGGSDGGASRGRHTFAPPSRTHLPAPPQDGNDAVVPEGSRTSREQRRRRHHSTDGSFSSQRSQSSRQLETSDEAAPRRQEKIEPGWDRPAGKTSGLLRQYLSPRGEGVAANVSPYEVLKNTMRWSTSTFAPGSSSNKVEKGPLDVGPCKSLPPPPKQLAPTQKQLKDGKLSTQRRSKSERALGFGRSDLYHSVQEALEDGPQPWRQSWKPKSNKFGTTETIRRSSDATWVSRKSAVKQADGVKPWQPLYAGHVKSDKEFVDRMKVSTLYRSDLPSDRGEQKPKQRKAKHPTRAKSVVAAPSTT